MKLFTKVIRKV